MKTPVWKGLTGAAVTMLVMGMAIAPAFADSGQGSHKNHGHGQQKEHEQNSKKDGWSSFFSAKGQFGFSSVLGEGFGNLFNQGKPLGPDGSFGAGGSLGQGGPLGPGGPFGPGTPFGPGGPMGPAGSSDGGAWHGHGNSVSRQVMIQEIQAAINYFNPLVQSGEAKLQTALQTAQSGSGSGNASLWTASDAALQVQIQAVLSQLAASQNPQQMAALVQQLGDLVKQLHQALDQSMQQGDSSSQLLTRDQQLLTRGGAYYSRLDQDMQTILGWLQNNNGGVSAHVRQEIRGIFDRYVTFSLYFTGDMDSSVAQLQASASGQGATTPPAPTQSGTVDAAASTVVDPANAVVAGQNFTVSGSVYAANGTPLAQASVMVSFDGVSTTATTASSGAYTATLAPKAAVANAPVTVTADGVSISTASDTGSVVAGQPANLTSSITAPVSAIANGQYAVTYTVTDQYGNPVSGVPVQFSLAQKVGNISEAQNETQESIGSLVTSTGNLNVSTDSSGQATVTYKASSTADGDGDLQDVVTASVANLNLANAQAVFTY